MKKEIIQPQLNLRRVMLQRNVSDTWLAAQINISRTAINLIINGHTSPSLRRLYQIADALNVHLFELFD